jgi:hypothetical protein
MKTKRKDVIVARLEGEVNEEIAYEYGISSFPKVVLFWPHSTDISSTFKKSRNVDNLLEWIEQKAPDLSKYRDKNGKLDLKLIEELENESESQDSNQVKSKEPIEIKNEKPQSIEEKNTQNNTNSSLEILKSDIKLLKNKYEELNKNFNEIKSQGGFKKIESSEKITPNLKMLNSHGIDSFDIIVTLLLFVIVVAAFFTIKKIYNKLL